MGDRSVELSFFPFYGQRCALVMISMSESVLERTNKDDSSQYSLLYKKI